MPCMVRGRGAFDPADAVIWITAALLAILCGAGAGFVLWSVLAGASAVPSVRAVVYLGGVACAIGAPMRRSLQLRLFVGLAVLALLASFSLGPTVWGPLLSR